MASDNTCVSQARERVPLREASCDKDLRRLVLKRCLRRRGFRGSSSGCLRGRKLGDGVLCAPGACMQGKIVTKVSLVPLQPVSS